MIQRFLLVIPALVAGLVSVAQQRTITMETELQRLAQTSLLPSMITDSYVSQISSYDRNGRNNDGFEGTHSFLRKNDDGSLVVFEAEGKGVIERIWTPTPTDDTLDFYFDGRTAPAYSIKFNDLFSGKVSPFLFPVVGKRVGGWYSYLPIPYSNGCKIVFRGKKMLFHQIQYRVYTGDQDVVSFSPSLTPGAEAVLKKISNRWQAAPASKWHLREEQTKTGTAAKVTNGAAETSTGDGAASKARNDMAAAVMTKKLELTLKPGASTTLINISKGGRIVGLEFSPAGAFAGLANSVDIRITWDGEKTPALYAPVADFFGYAFGSPSMKGHMVGVDDKKAYCYIPMPFDRSAKVELIYRKTSGIQSALKISGRVEWISEKRRPTEGKFYAYWKREVPASGKPYVFLAGSGKGHYIGTLLWGQARTYNHHTEFFEGDDSTVLDGKHLLHGTGSEDYFNGGWYAQPNGWVERKGMELSGCLDYSLPKSRTGGYRYYMLDKLPFQNSIYHSMEHGPEGNNRKVEYTSLAMYYAGKPVTTGAAPTNATSAVFVADTFSFYPRLMDHVSYAGGARQVNGDAEIAARAEGTFVVDTRDVSPGKYKLYVHGRGVHGINIRLPGQQVKSTLMLKEGKNSERMSDYVLGNVTISEGQQSLPVLVNAGADNVQIAIFHLARE